MKAKIFYIVMDIIMTLLFVYMLIAHIGDHNTLGAMIGLVGSIIFGCDVVNGIHEIKKLKKK